MTENEYKQAKKDRAWWKEYETDDWSLYGFTQRHTASFRNSKTGRTIQLDGEYLSQLTEAE
jgi:hypothetical protein